MARRAGRQLNSMLHHMLHSLLSARLNPRLAHLLFIASAVLPLVLAALRPGEARAGQGLTVGRLRCEGLAEPMGMQEAQPRLSWIVESERRGERQTGYRILVASSEETLAADRGDLWDTGKVEGGATSLIPYAGKAL